MDRAEGITRLKSTPEVAPCAERIERPAGLLPRLRLTGGPEAVLWTQT